MQRLNDEEIVRLRAAVRGMALLNEDRGYEFNREWVEQQGWVVVPVEDTVHFAEEEIAQIVPALLAAGHHRCLALGALKLPEPLPHAFEVSISADDLREFNAECGIFRFLLVPPDHSWAISCNEWFNVFAGPASLVQRLIGISIPQALEEFLAYARVVDQGQEGYLVQVARQYGA